MNGIFSSRSTSDLNEDKTSKSTSSTASNYGPALSAKGVSDTLTTDLADAASKGTNPVSVLGATVHFKGELVADEDLMIQGRIEGSIEQKASHLTIGSKGKIKADIHANHVLVQGEVIGDLYATEAVVVAASARVRGNISAPRVTLNDGAQFKGSIDMDAGENARIKPKAEAGASTLAVVPNSATNGKNGGRRKDTASESDTDEFAETTTEKILP